MRERDAWDRLADGYMDRVFSAILFSEKRQLLVSLAPSFGRVLDLGCGPLPFLTEDLAKRPAREVIACDFSLPMIAALRKSLRSPRAELLVAEGRALPLQAQSLDAVLAVNSILPEQRPEVDLILAEVARVMRPGGRLIALLPAFEMSVIAAEHWGVDTRIDRENHREYDTTGWQCFFTVADIDLLMKRHAFSRFDIGRLYFSSDDEAALIRKVYGQRIPLETLQAYPLFEHLLVANR